MNVPPHYVTVAAPISEPHYAAFLLSDEGLTDREAGVVSGGVST